MAEIWTLTSLIGLVLSVSTAIDGLRAWRWARRQHRPDITAAARAKARAGIIRATAWLIWAVLGYGLLVGGGSRLPLQWPPTRWHVVVALLDIANFGLLVNEILDRRLYHWLRRDST